MGSSRNDHSTNLNPQPKIIKPNMVIRKNPLWPFPSQACRLQNPVVAEVFRPEGRIEGWLVGLDA